MQLRFRFPNDRRALVDHPRLGRFPICLSGDREKIHSTLRLSYLEGLHSPSVLFVLPGKLNVRSVPYTDLVKIAQSGYSGGTRPRMLQPGKIRSWTSRNLPVGKLGHMVRLVEAIIQIPAPHSREVGTWEVLHMAPASPAGCPAGAPS